jgi:hypothetical protein
MSSGTLVRVALESSLSFGDFGIDVTRSCGSVFRLLAILGWRLGKASCVVGLVGVCCRRWLCGVIAILWRCFFPLQT